MFTEQDYKNYFSIIKDLELKMISNVNKIIPAVADPDVSKILKNIDYSEHEHLKRVDELLSFIPEQKE